MACHANNELRPPRVRPHTTARTRQPRVRLTISAVADLLLSAEEAYALADQLVDVADLIDTSSPSSP